MTAQTRKDCISLVRYGGHEGSVEKFLTDIQRDFGVLHVVYHGASLRTLTDRAPYLKLTYPDSWVSHYVSQGYFKIDPVVLAADNCAAPYNWDDLDWSAPKVAAFKKLSEEYGVGRTGVTVPIKGRHGEESLFSVSSNLGKQEWRMYLHEALPDLELVAKAVHEKVIEIEDVELETSVRPLSKRELDALRLASEGLTGAQIAEEMGIGERTVRDHLERAGIKLEASNRTHAVSRAIGRGLIPAPE